MRRVLPFSTLTLLVVSVSVFVFFKAFNFDKISGYSVEILAAFLGSIVTMIVTTVLLRAQTISEINREKSMGVFEAKLKVYNEFLEDLNRIIYDGQIDKDEAISLRNWVLKLGLFAGHDAYNDLVQFVEQSLIFHRFDYHELTPEEKEAWEKRLQARKLGGQVSSSAPFVTIGQVVSALRRDLGESDISNDAGTIWSYIDDIIYDRANSGYMRD